MNGVPPLRTRRPPPSRHRRTIGGVMDHPKSNRNEQRKSEKSGKKGVYVNQCKRRRKKMLTTTLNIESLPDEMVMKILVQLPAHDIYDIARFVCRRWYDMVHSHHFIHDHLQRSTTGLLIQRRISKDAVFISMRPQGGGVEISEISYQFTQMVFTSCNGLVLVPVFNKLWEIDDLFIANPATKQHFRLPTLCNGMSRHDNGGLAYVPSSMKYKVVFTYSPDKRHYWDSHCFAVLTVGVDDSWRHVSTDHLSGTAKTLLYSSPLVTGIFVHWFGYEKSCVVTLNVETENVREYYVPQGYGERFKRYLSMGSSLSFLTASVGVLFSWEVWEMMPQTGEWTKLLPNNIELEAQMVEQLFSNNNHDNHHRELHVIGWLKYKEVMVFRVAYSSTLWIAYDVHTREVHQFELDNNSNQLGYHHYCPPHVNSLVRLDGS